MRGSLLRLTTILTVANLIIAPAAVVLAALLRFGPERWQRWDVLPASPLVLLALYTGIWLLILGACGAYRPGRLWLLRQEAGLLSRCTVLFALVVLSLLTAFKIYNVSRLFLALAFSLQFGLTLLARGAVRFVLVRSAAASRNARRVLIVGTDEPGQAFARMLAQHPELGIRVLGFVTDGKETGVTQAAAAGTEQRPEVAAAGDSGSWDAASAPAAEGAAGPPLLGCLDDLPALLAGQVVDEVVVALPFDAFSRIRQVVRECEAQGKDVHLLANGLETRVARSRVTELNGLPLLSLVSGPDAPLALALKRLMDVTVSAALLVLLSPLMLAVAAAIKLTSPGPAIFRQQRVGLNGRPFTLYKFRSMVADAEARLAEVRHLNEMSGPVFKARNDPRITPLGRWLRRTSLDELPQLWNVLKGDMSLVGPRPPLPNEVSHYKDYWRRRLSMKPGLSCLWQVNGRNDIADFEDWVRLDLEYIEQWNLWLDAKILARTVPEVLAMRGR